MADAPTYWFDVEDLFEHRRRKPRLSGIQRVVFEICRECQRMDAGAGRIRFLRHAPDGASLIPVEWADVEELFRGADPTSLSSAEPIAGGAVTPTPRVSFARASVRRLLRAIPGELRRPLVLSAVLHVETIISIVRFAVGFTFALPLTGWRVVRLIHARRSGAATDRDAVARAMAGTVFSQLARPGDAYVVLGSLWTDGAFAARVSWVREALGLRTAIMMYDLTPIRHPEWCDRGVIDTFKAWHASVLPLVDVVFAISRYTAADVKRYAHEAGFCLPAPVRVVPLGAGFGGGALGNAALPAGLTEAGDASEFVLCVSTIEARKNHILLFRVWRRLLQELPASAVPKLVFAGDIGWLVQDLLQQLENARYLDGKIMIARSPSDAELAALYRNCLFSVFPSFFEGWGLPVTESMAFGTPCLASDRASLPEAGGPLARYFDPGDVGSAYRAIREILDDRLSLADWRAQVAREFQPASWADAARVVLLGCEAPDPRGV